jgi:hypothetical protein
VFEDWLVFEIFGFAGKLAVGKKPAKASLIAASKF